jgi:hypothetical protein
VLFDLTGIGADALRPLGRGLDRVGQFVWHITRRYGPSRKNWQGVWRGYFAAIASPTLASA